MAESESSTGAASLVAFAKLNGENYRNWAFRVKNTLKYKKLWKCVAETVPGPDGAKAVTFNQEEDDQALSVISLGCDDLVKDLIVDCETAKEAWNVLREKYVRKTPAAKVALYCALFGLLCDDLAGVKDLLGEFSVIVRKLQELSVEVDSDMYSIMLLRALPATFEQFRVAVMTRDELPTLEEIKMKVEEERLRQLQGQHVVAQSASDSVSVALSVNKGSVKCFKCHQPGHFARECKSVRGQRRENNFGGRGGGGGSNARGQGKLALFATALSATSTSRSSRNTLYHEKWIIDGGCTIHVCRERGMFENFRIQREEVKLPNGSFIMSQGIGTVVLKTPFRELELRDVRYIPEFFCNFLSVPAADRKGCVTTLSGGRATITYESRMIAEGPMDENGNYVLVLAQGGVRSEKVCGSINTERRSLSLMEWHRRLGHLNMDSIVKMRDRGLVEGLELTSTTRTACEVCARSKITKESHPAKASHRATDRIHRIHSDVCEMPARSYGGAKYFVTFVDDHTRYTRVYCIAQKSDVLACWRKFKALVENQCGTSIKVLRSDNGREYINREFEEELSSCGIMHETTVPESPAQNGVAERMNRSLTEMVRCMLLDGGMPQAAWAEAIQTAAYIRNRSQSSVTAVTPFELMYGRKPTMGHMERFGAKVVALKKNRDLQKLQPKGDVMRFCGYAPFQKGYRMLCTRGGQLMVSRDCRFLDNNEEVVHLPTCESSTDQHPAEDERRTAIIVQQDAEEELFLDCEKSEPGTSGQREQPARAAKVPRNYKDVSSDDEGW